MRVRPINVRPVNPVKNVLLVSEHPVPTAPIFSLAPVLNRLGVQTRRADEFWSSTRHWLRLALQSQMVVFVFYNRYENMFFQRQVYRARLMGCQVVRWWVGSDVFWSCMTEESKAMARTLDQAVDLNIAVSPHLVAELVEIGITAEYVPSPFDLPAVTQVANEPLPKGVLTYLPSERKAFYGEAVLIAAIEANPDLLFYVVSDDSHSLQHYPNVVSLGWVGDMEGVWDKVGVLLRVTTHDGMPRMVLEALARSRYVIYSEQFDGCWFARSPEDVNAHLNTFKTLREPNDAGPRVAHGIARDAGPMYVQQLLALKTGALLPRRIKSMITSVVHVK